MATLQRPASTTLLVDKKNSSARRRGPTGGDKERGAPSLTRADLLLCSADGKILQERVSFESIKLSLNGWSREGGQFNCSREGGQEGQV